MLRHCRFPILLDTAGADSPSQSLFNRSNYSGSRNIRSKITNKLHSAPQPTKYGNDYESNADSEFALQILATPILNKIQDLYELLTTERFNIL